MNENQAGGGYIKGQAKDCRDQKQRWKNGEVNRAFCINGQQKHQQGNTDGGNQKHVQRDRR